MGAFIYFIPSYAISHYLAYLLTRRFSSFFDRSKRVLFVLKVLLVTAPLFVVLFAAEVWLIGVYVKSFVWK